MRDTASATKLDTQGTELRASRMLSVQVDPAVALYSLLLFVVIVLVHTIFLMTT